MSAKWEAAAALVPLSCWLLAEDLAKACSQLSRALQIYDTRAADQPLLSALATVLVTHCMFRRKSMAVRVADEKNAHPHSAAPAVDKSQRGK